MTHQLHASKLKVTLVLKADELMALPTPEGVARAHLHIELPGRSVTADIAAKSLRKAQATIKSLGAEGVALVLQGHLVGNAIAEAGLAAQVKAPKA